MKKIYALALAAAVAFTASAKENLVYGPLAGSLPVRHEVKKELKAAEINLNKPVFAKAAANLTAEDIAGAYYWDYVSLLSMQEDQDYVELEVNPENANEILIYGLISLPIKGTYDAATATLTIPSQVLGVIDATDADGVAAQLSAEVVIFKINAAGDSFKPTTEPFTFTFTATGATAPEELIISVGAYTPDAAHTNKGYFFAAMQSTLTKDTWTQIGEATFVDGIMPCLVFENPVTVTSKVIVERNDQDPTVLRMVSPWTGTFDKLLPEDAGTPKHISPDFEFCIEDPEYVYAPFQSSGVGSKSKGTFYIVSVTYVVGDKAKFLDSKYKDMWIKLEGNVLTFAPSSIHGVYTSDTSKLINTENLESTLTLPEGWNNAGGNSGVTNVAAESNAPVEYFNLQGVRVANPENGLYIKRQGKNVTKVLVK